MGTLEGCISGLVPLMHKSAQALEDIAQVIPGQYCSCFYMAKDLGSSATITESFIFCHPPFSLIKAPPSIGGWKAGSANEPNKSVLEDQLVSAVAAIATMSNSGPVAARIASTKGLTQVMTCSPY